MKTECTLDQMEFHAFGRREIVGRFDGGQISSDGGALLLRETEHRTGILSRLARQFIDYRDPERIEHGVDELVAQRVLGIALGYEDLNDHDALSSDFLLAMLVGKSDPTGQDRLRERDQGKPLASSSTLNRLELSLPDAIMAWCEQRPGVPYLLGLAKNARLKRVLGCAMQAAQVQYHATNQAARKVWLSFSESYPYVRIFQQVMKNLHAFPRIPCDVARPHRSS